MLEFSLNNVINPIHNLLQIMWPEVAQAREENRHELVLSGDLIEKQIKDCDGLDPEIFNLIQLNYLKVSSTSLDKIPETICSLENLTNLVLQANQLTSLPESIGKLTKLKLLDISQNSLEEIPNSIGLLDNLSTLNARNNNISNIDSLKTCSHLAHVDLRNNSLSSFPDICSEDLSFIADLLFSGNKIDSIPENINVLSSLKCLDLIDNCIKEIPGELADCPKLKG